MFSGLLLALLLAGCDEVLREYVAMLCVVLN